VIRGLYTSASGMLFQTTRMDSIANNMANVGTPGYMRDDAVARGFPEMLLWRVRDAVPVGAWRCGRAVPIGVAGTGVLTDGIAIDMSRGELKRTGGVLDLALEGPGLFAVETPAGMRYTRHGAFTTDGQGYIATPQGHRLLGADGPIRLGQGEPVVAGDGTVTQRGEAVGRIQVFDLPPTGLRKQGENLLEAIDPLGVAEVEAPVIKQGYLEMSNVNPVLEMTEMIEALRTYEANQRAFRAQDQALGQAVNEVGRL